MAALTSPADSRGRLREVTLLFLRLGLTAFGGPAAHIALIERACVRDRRWLTREELVDLLGVANLIPGPTSTELAMHVGRRRAGLPGLVAAGLAFILPSALLVGTLAALYVRSDELPLMRGVLAGVQPVVLIVIADALRPLAKTALTSALQFVIGAAAVAAVIAGASEILVLLAAGLVHVVAPRRPSAVALLLIGATCVVSAAGAAGSGVVSSLDVFGYFARVGSLLFGSGYVLLPVSKVTSCSAWDG